MHLYDDPVMHFQRDSHRCSYKSFTETSSPFYCVINPLVSFSPALLFLLQNGNFEEERLFKLLSESQSSILNLSMIVRQKQRFNVIQNHFPYDWLPFKTSQRQRLTNSFPDGFHSIEIQPCCSGDWNVKQKFSDKNDIIKRLKRRSARCSREIRN